MRYHTFRAAVFAVVLLGFGLPARAQETGQPPAFASAVAARVLFAPSTYAPAAIWYSAAELDWSSSQPLFRGGYVEKNARFTVTGTAFSTPIGYAAGRRKNAASALRILGVSAGHNLASAVLEQWLYRRWPDHPRAIRTLLWVERIAFAAWQSYDLSSGHFRQWQRNERMYRALAAR
jgi:hypothetical protein